MTTLHPMFDPGPSCDALALYRVVCHYGGALRIPMLLKHVAISDHATLRAAIGELAERYWIRIVYREPPPETSGPLDQIERLVATRFGRKKYRATRPSF